MCQCLLILTGKFSYGMYTWHLCMSLLSFDRYVYEARVFFVVNSFYIELFSALEQTHSALVACDSK